MANYFMSSFNPHPVHICIVRLSAIGDVCNAASIINRLKMQWHDVQITWICGPTEAQLLKLIPQVEIIEFNKKATWRGYAQVWRQLSEHQFDILLHLQASMRASILTLGLHSKRRIGYHKSRAYELQWLFTKEKTAAPKGWHVVDNYQAFADYLKCPVSPVNWPFVIPKPATLRAEQLTHHLHQPFIAICPAASKAYKNWHVAGYVEVIKKLQVDYPIVLVGSAHPIEKQMAEEIMAKVNAPITNLVGQTSLPELLALLAKARLLITPDTGPAHMAASQHTPVVGLYAHHNPQRVGPYGSLDHVVSHWDELIQAQTGKPISELPWRIRVKDPTAMNTITVTEVLSQVAQQLAAEHTNDECEPLNRSY